jgi:GNAT superfamily N-acetyltransferase
MDTPFSIERLSGLVSDNDLRALGRLLVEAVRSGAAVSFMATLTHDGAEAWWRETMAASNARAIFLVARAGGDIVGTVQVHPAWAPNQPDRGDVAKLLVDGRYHRRGIGAALMREVERAARASGFRLLTLDAKRGAAAEQLYRQMGWVPAGTIPRYALDPDGAAYHDAVVFYKELDR